MTFEKYATEALIPYKKRDWLVCKRHLGLVLPKGHVVKGKDGWISDGMCKRCCREWIDKFGDEASKWVLAQLKELEKAVSRGEYS